ncbi:neuromedin Bb [Trichomycterus rosablanca]|uniref:neuromedin Bb n=1 Tax=Trichomycterus rosablanca TaxID=2290929 RepID=UPI002F3553FB
MSGFTLHCFAVGFFTYLVLFSFISITSSVNLDLSQLSNKVAKIKVSPRGNLWATGHFMGKKSIVDSALLQPKDNTMSTVKLEPDGYQDAQKIFKQIQLDPQGSSIKITDAALLMKVLENYVQGNRK